MTRGLNIFPRIRLSNRYMLQVGDHIPDFALENSFGAEVQIADILAKGPAVIFFYPKDNTRGCTIEACGFRDRYTEFVEAGATVIGISSDSIKSHQRFKQQHNLPFILLSDRTKQVRKQFGVPGTFLGLIPGRVTFVVDQQGVIQHIFNSQIQAERHVEEALQVIRSMQPARANTSNG